MHIRHAVEGRHAGSFKLVPAFAEQTTELKRRKK